MALRGGVILCLAILTALIFAGKNKFIKRYKKRLLVVLLSAILIPLTIGALKKFTHMPCPSQISHFDGKFPDIKIFEKYDTNFKDKQHARCFPAGHATIGFCFMSCCFLFRNRRNKFISFGIGIILGWITGGYKMALGDHFLSHTIVTMILSWIIILVNVRIIFLTKYKLKNK